MEWKCWSCSYYQYMYWETTPKIVPCCTHPYIWGSDLGHRRSSLPWPLPIKYSLDFWALSVEIHAHITFISSIINRFNGKCFVTFLQFLIPLGSMQSFLTNIFCAMLVKFSKTLYIHFLATMLFKSTDFYCLFFSSLMIELWK